MLASLTFQQQDFFQLAVHDKEWLVSQWRVLTQPFGAAESVSQKVLNQLLRHYEARGRHYHNASHLVALLKWAEKYRAALHQPEAVYFAIWFHDVIYRSRRHDNETRSAVYAADALSQLLVPPQLSESVQLMIRATQKHELASVDAPSAELAEDLRWFLDFDLAILGSAPEIYARYAQAIRREYAWVPGLLYRKGRRQVLEKFQARPQLFFTETMRAQLETQARQNITQELSQLA